MGTRRVTGDSRHTPPSERDERSSGSEGTREGVAEALSDQGDRGGGNFRARGIRRGVARPRRGARPDIGPPTSEATTTPGRRAPR